MESLLTTNDRPHTIIHANAMLLKDGSGLLVLGDAGSGKTELCVSLIKQGHQFIADDAVLLYRIGNDLFAKAPERGYNLMHRKNQGLLSITKVFGKHSLASQAQIDRVITLSPQKETIKLLGISVTPTPYQC